MNKILFKDQKSNVIVRIENFFTNQRCDIILSKAIAIDQKTQSFFIVVTNRENKITIRLDPITDPEKTHGVKTAIALMAKRIQDIEKIIRSLCFKDKHSRIHRQTARAYVRQGIY